MTNEPTRKPPLKPKTGALGGPRPVPGPTLHSGGTLPCGCKVANDPEDNKLRYWFCPPHAVAYDMLDVLQQAQGFIDDLANNPPEDYDPTAAMDLGMRTRKVLKKAKGDWR